MKDLFLLITLLGLLLSSCAQPQVKSDSALGIQELSADQFKQYVDKGDMIIVDVRTPAEYAQGHIPGAINVDFNNPNFTLQLEEMDKSKNYLMHCLSGGRSAQALKIFKSIGFKNVGHLTNGIQEWEQKGYPIVQ